MNRDPTRSWAADRVARTPDAQRSTTPDQGRFDSAYFEEVYQTTFYRKWQIRARDARLVALADRYSDTNGDGRLLEVGCGYGHLLHRFSDRYEVVAVDVSRHAVARTRDVLGVLGVVCADVQSLLPFRKPFDLVLAINVLEHVADPEAAVRSIATALAPGGLCLLHMPTISGPITRFVYRFTYDKDPTHVYRPSGAEVRKLFERCGFEALHESFAPHVPRWLWRRLKWHPAYLGVYRLVDRVAGA